MPHNHQPRCCCQHVQDGAITVQSVPCPSCVEHGELAQLSQPHAIAYNPEDEDNDPWHAPLAGNIEVREPGECPSCHTHAGQPHTDYCQTSQPAATTSQPPTHLRDVPTCPCQTRPLGEPGRHHPLCQHHPINRTLPPQ
jgi:hypothetical protein